jgi:hypothetical protein
VVVGVPATDKARLSAGLGWNVAGVSHPLTDPAVELFLQFPVEFLEGLHPLTEITVIREMTVIDRDRVFPCLLFQQVLMCLDVVTDLIDHFTLPDVLVLEMLKLGEDVTRRIPLRDLLQAVLEYADLIAVVLDGNVIPFGGSGIDLARAADGFLVLHHLLPLAIHPANGPRRTSR